MPSNGLAVRFARNVKVPFSRRSGTKNSKREYQFLEYVSFSLGYVGFGECGGVFESLKYQFLEAACMKRAVFDV